MVEPTEITKVKHSVKFDDYTIVLHFQNDEDHTVFLGGNKPLIAPGDQSEDEDENISWSELPDDYQKYLSDFVQYRDFTKKDNK